MSGRASLYVRLSRSAQSTNLSLIGMMEDARKRAMEMGLVVVSEHRDDGVSGAVRDREAFLAWLEDARSGVVDTLVTYHADRLTREGVNVAAMVLDVVEGKDPVTGKVVRDPVRLVDCHGLDSNDGDSFRLRFVIAAEVGRSERERIKERNLRTQARLREAGRHRGGAAPFGTMAVPNPDGGGRVLVPDPDEAALLQEAARKLLAGEPMRGVLAWLNERTQPRQGTKRSRSKWQSSSLRGTLRGQAVRAHVLDLATQRALEERFAANRTSGGGRPRRFLLSGGLAVCHNCGTKLTTSRDRYICRTGAEDVPCGKGVTLTITHADAWFEQEFLDRFGSLRALERRVIVSGGGDVDGAERAVLAAEAELLADLTPENLAAVQQAREALDDAKNMPPILNTVWAPTDFETIGEKWDAADLQGRNSMLASVLDGPAVVHPSTQTNRRIAPDVAARVEVPWTTGERLWGDWPGTETVNVH